MNQIAPGLGEGLSEFIANISNFPAVTKIIHLLILKFFGNAGKDMFHI